MAAPTHAPEPPIVTDPVVPPPPDGAPPPNDGYTSTDFAFLEEETGHDVKGWLTFVESRAESRADRTKRFRRRLIGAGAAVAVVAAGIGAYALFNGGSLTGGGGGAKSVILLQVSDSTGNAVADALLVTDHSATTGTGSSKTVTGKGAGVLIPSQMIVNSTGFGQQPFGGDMAQSIPAAGKDTVSDALGVTVDGVWRMDEITFAGLIDEIGGIQLNANVAVPAVTASPTAAAIPAGNQKLTGGQAVAYGIYAPKGDNPDAQIERFGQVVNGLLNALPTDPGAVTAYLNHLGIVDDPALPESKLSPILAALAVEQQAGAFTAKALPLRTDGSNALNIQAAAPIVSSLLGGALNTQNNGQISRVLVEDASGHTGNASQAIRGAAQARLSNGGYTFIDGSTAAHRATSVVEVGSDGAKTAAVQIAATLGLQPDSVQVVSGMSTFADVTVLLGADWPKIANVTLPATN
ncbi:MAG TPA: LCP family protein [Actinocrinis sp.]|nr:LCP family protein [Actinocrinis sp.]